ncbi:MAG: SIR2 family protein [Bacteroidetes bacterium]|nr:SIR2 family protein [Bacteroidota bacterium]
MSNNIAFLFGAGVSIPAKIPSIKCITEKIFSGKGIVRGTYENYFFGNPEKFNWDLYQEFIPRIKTFLELLKNELWDYYKDSNESVNYEDIYYLLDFIRKNIYGTEKNPAFKYLLKNFEKTIKELSSPIDPLIDSEITLETLLNETVQYIEYSVIFSLFKRPDSFKGLAFLNEFISESDFSRIDIFTLNHDIVIEKYLQSISKNFCDGFGAENDGYKFWDQTLFGLDNEINLFKLHGSIDWYYFDETSWVDRRICKCSSEILWRDPRKSIILIGTYNKLAKYIESIFLELFCLFYKTMYMHNTIIISGYGFGDSGINEKLFNWVLQENNKMIIIDPNVESLRNKMWSVLDKKWGENKKIVPIKEYIENISWLRLKKYL